MIKLITALSALAGVSIAENATEDEALAAIKAHKPQSPHVVIDFEDTAVKAAFAKAITDATKADKDSLTALQTELTSIKALMANGAAGAAGGGAAAPTVPAKTENTMARSAFNKLPHADRNAFMASGGKLED